MDFKVDQIYTWVSGTNRGQVLQIAKIEGHITTLKCLRATNQKDTLSVWRVGESNDFIGITPRGWKDDTICTDWPLFYEKRRAVLR